MTTKTILTLDILKEIYDCIQSSKYKNDIKIEYLGTDGEIPGFKIISSKMLTLDEKDEIMDTIYDCIDKYDPNLVIHFEWETI